MKKIILVGFVFNLMFSLSGQDVVGANNLVNDENFINWVSNVTNNEWDIQVDLKKQIGDRTNAFKAALLKARNDEDVNTVISDFGVNSEYSDQKMAEHIVFGLYLKQENQWLWNMSPTDRIQIIKDAYFIGMSSLDPRWTAIRNNLINKIWTHCGTTGRITPSEIADCFWDVLVSAVEILGGITSIVTAINGGNWSAAVAAVKKLLKSAARKFGWVGLAIAAIDVAICIWGANDN